MPQPMLTEAHFERVIVPIEEQLPHHLYNHCTLNMFVPMDRRATSPQLVQPLLHFIRALTVGVPNYGKFDAANKA